MMNNFPSFTEAYVAVVKAILEDGLWVEGVKDSSSIGSDFGKNLRRTKEILVYSFCVENPRDRIAEIENRKINRKYALANFLWMLLGTRDGSFIVPFNEKGKAFLDEKMEINSAIGPHLFKFLDGAFLELESIEKILKTDPSSRRAVLQLFQHSDLINGKKDVPCFNHLQFFLRNNFLHCHVVMRSQSALMVLPYDFYLFSLLHEALSVRLNVQLGRLFYTCNSLHIYEDEIDMAISLEANVIEDVPLLKMEVFENDTIERLKAFFLELSYYYSNGKNMINPLDNLDKYQLDFYWTTTLRNCFDTKVSNSN